MRRNAAFVAGLLTLHAAPAFAQRTWLTPDPGRSIGVEIEKGIFSPGSGTDFASFVVEADGRLPIGRRIAITASVPYSRISEEGTFRSTSFGNPWIGVEAMARADLSLEAGIRPGLVHATINSGEAEAAGIIEDFDRFEAWMPDVTSVRLMAHAGRVPDRGTFLTARLGGTLFFPAQGAGSDLYANYGLRLGVRDAHVITGLSVTGRVELGHNGVMATLDRAVHQAAVTVEGVHGALRPSVSVGSFINPDERESITAIVRVGATFIY